MKLFQIISFTVLVSSYFVSWALAEPGSIERGKYLSIIGGCNDCHTAGYAPSGGEIPMPEWLKGDPIGWRGPWGTTYAINLRNFVSRIGQDAWIAVARNSKARPPMPTHIVKTMSDDDLSALYLFIKSLGAAGREMPPALAPGIEPKTPYINFVPIEPN